MPLPDRLLLMAPRGKSRWRSGANEIPKSLAIVIGAHRAPMTNFIGTRKGYDTASEPLLPPDGKAAGRTEPHRRYSKDVGAVLAEVPGPHAAYTMRGDELYVRAKIISSKPKPNASVANEVECAWTQPLAGTAK